MMFRSKIIHMLAIMVSICICACHTTKKAVSDQKLSTDSSKVLRTDTVRNDSIAIVKETTKDTAITVAGNTAVQVLPTKSLQPGTSYRKSSGHVHNTVSTDSAGNIHVECKADSLLLVIRNLTERTTLLQRNSNRNSSNSSHTATAKTETYTSTIVKVKSWMAGNWYWVLLAVVVVLVIELVYRVRKRITHPPNPFI